MNDQDKISADVAAVRARQGQADAAERSAGIEIDPGLRALIIAVLVLVLLASLMLPHAGGATGWDVLAGDEHAIEASTSIASRAFLWLIVVFGGLGSILALVTRRWAVAWVALAGTAMSIPIGLLAIWSRLTPTRNEASAGPAVATTHSTSSGGGNALENAKGVAVHAVTIAGPGAGLVIALVVAVLLTYFWLRVVWMRNAGQLAAEHDRRATADEQEQLVLEQMRRSSERSRE